MPNVSASPLFFFAVVFSETITALPLEWMGAVSARQISTADQTPITASGDLWATVVANVAPVMALVGERNAKEFLRMSSSLDQLALMATAPLGILTLMICAIRLSGPRMLRRVVGRESDRHSEALVELTPLSVSPGSSVYTPKAVEIEPGEQRDRLAFVCAHISHTDKIYDAITAFKNLLKKRNDKAKTDDDELGFADQDYEIVLGVKRSTLTANETASLIRFLIDEKETAGGSSVIKSLAARIESVSLSFRLTGISPTQTAPDGEGISKLPQLSQVRNALIGAYSFVLMCGVQIGGYYSRGDGKHSPGSLTMGLVGYCGIVASTFLLLVIIKQEIKIEPQELPHFFEQAVWTFSDSRHAEHQRFSKPPNRHLVQAAPANSTNDRKRWREPATFFTCITLTGSYVVYYLGIRVAPWWVAFANLVIIWLAAALRASVIKGFLHANGADLGEHWLGIFRDDLAESLLETVAITEKNIKARTTQKNTAPTTDGEKIVETVAPKNPTVMLNSREIECPDPAPNDPNEKILQVSHTETTETNSLKREHRCSLVVAKPTRQSLRNWSGCEDVMKVALEMAKHAGRTKVFGRAGELLGIHSMPAFKRVIPFQLMIYVPGVLWKAETELDYVLTANLDIPNLYRDTLKLFHLCHEVTGSVSRHDLTKTQEDELSNVLCGPIEIPPPKDLPDGSSTTLVALLCLLRDQQPEDVKAYTLDQAMLLPTIQLASMYESYRDDRKSRSSWIQQLQNGHTDKLGLSGSDHLGTLEHVFEENEIWRHFLRPKKAQPAPELQPRDETSGLYGRPARRIPDRREKRNEESWLQAVAFRDRPGRPGR